MIKYVFSLVLLALIHGYSAQTTVNGSFVHGGITRTYSFYVPASYVPGDGVPMVIGLHGTSSTGDQFAQYRDFRPIADTANFIMVHPDGSTMLGITFWNYGNIMGSTVDDVGFLEALIDTISASYTINPNRIYCTGMSNGSFMSYALACESNRFAAIAGVTGSMSVAMYNSCIPERPIPTLHIHGTNDGTNPYTGNSTMKAIEEVTQFWVNQNNCNPIPIVTTLPNIDVNDGATTERYLYENGIHGHTVELFKVIGGEHTWPGSPMPSSSAVTCMDFDASIEIWRFFSQYETTATASIDHSTVAELTIYPNPTQGELYIQSGNDVVTKVIIMDMQGRIVKTIAKDNITSISVKELQAGNYIANFLSKNWTSVKKLVVSE